jgi:CheY-like chemotaxis protein
MERQAPLIMVVDDNPDFLDVVSHILEAKGYRVCCCAAADEAQALRIPADSRKIPYVMKHLKAIGEARDRLGRVARK